MMAARVVDPLVEEHLAAGFVHRLDEVQVLLLAEVRLVGMRTPHEAAHVHAFARAVGEHLGDLVPGPASSSSGSPRQSVKWIQSSRSSVHSSAVEPREVLGTVDEDAYVVAFVHARPSPRRRSISVASLPRSPGVRNQSSSLTTTARSFRRPRGRLLGFLGRFTSRLRSNEPRRAETMPASTPISIIASRNSRSRHPSGCSAPATTTISLIAAMMPTSRNGSATSRCSRMITRTAPSNSTKMKTMSRMLSVSVVAATTPSSTCSKKTDDRLDEQHQRAADEDHADEHVDDHLGVR